MYVNPFSLPKNDRRSGEDSISALDRNLESSTKRLERILNNLENRRNTLRAERPKAANTEIRWLG